MAQPVFPAYVAYGRDASKVEEYTPGAGANEPFLPGDLVKLSSEKAVLCGADPASVHGISEVDSEKAKLLTANGKVPVLVLDDETVLCMCSDTVPVEATHLGNEYGVANAGNGVWKVDTAEVTTKVVQVVRLNIPEGRWYVKVIDTVVSND